MRHCQRAREAWDDLNPDLQKHSIACGFHRRFSTSPNLPLNRPILCEHGERRDPQLPRVMTSFPVCVCVVYAGRAQTTQPTTPASA